MRTFVTLNTSIHGDHGIISVKFQAIATEERGAIFPINISIIKATLHIIRGQRQETKDNEHAPKYDDEWESLLYC